jgi:predicted DCC family thiol-disulfide oxidoreductase YuxK
MDEKTLMPTGADATKNDVWYVYDGECPLCRTAANALRIREAVGQLHLINARLEPNHPVIQEINTRQIDIDKGSVITYGGNFYHGADALVLTALLGSNAGWFNKLNALLFRSPASAKLCYPLLRAGRNLLLRIRGIAQIRNLQPTVSTVPLFQSIFGDTWSALPAVMHTHYDVRAGSADRVTVEGIMTVKRSFTARLLSPLLTFFGALVPHSGDNIPVTVKFYSAAGTRRFYFDRMFHFPHHAPYRFLSCMEQLQGNHVVEFMRFGIGWHSRYFWDGQKIRLEHVRFVCRVLGMLIPLPLEWLMGRGAAWEEPLSDESFRMWMGVVHPWFGETYSYSGTFRVTEVNHG